MTTDCTYILVEMDPSRNCVNSIIDYNWVIATLQCDVGMHLHTGSKHLSLAWKTPLPQCLRIWHSHCGTVAFQASTR